MTTGLSRISCKECLSRLITEASSGIGHKVKKKLEGTVAGMVDVMLLINNEEGRTAEVFIEFKRISTPAAIKPRESQIDTQNKLSSMGYDVYLINNTVFFKMVILKEALQKLRSTASYGNSYL